MQKKFLKELHTTTHKVVKYFSIFYVYAKRNWIILGLVALICIFVAGYLYLQSYLNAPLLTKEDIEKYKAIAAQQNEEAFLQWEFQENRFKKRMN